MKKALFIGLTLGLLVSGCNKDDSLKNGDGPGVRFTSYMVESRATDTAWEAGDVIGVYMQNTNTASGYQKINVKYANTEDDVNSFVSDTPITYSGNESTVSFMAVYPYNENITDGNYTFTLGNESLSENDIMYASASSITAGTTNVSLNFRHKLTKIVLQISDADGNAVTDATVSIDKQCVKGVLNVADGTVNVANNAAYTSTLNFAELNGTYEVIVIPDEGYEGRSIVITSGGKTYRCPVENISFGGSKKYTFPVSLQSSSTSSPGGSTEGETIIDLITANIEIDDWTDEKSTGWIISSDAEISTENKTRTELATDQSLSTNSPVEITPLNGMTLKATDVYCIEYSRTDADVTDATLIVSQPTTRSGSAQKTYTLPAGLSKGQLVFAVGEFTNGFSVSSTVALTLDAVSVYSESTSSETPSNPDETELWSGECVFVDDWSAGESLGFSEGTPAVGDIVRFYYKDKTEGAQISFANSIIDVTDNLGYVDVEVTADIYNTIWNGDYPGWSYVNGVKMTLIKVTLLGSSNSGSEDTETPSNPDETELWTGECVFKDDWSAGESLGFSEGTPAVGDIVRFYYKDKTEGAQIGFANNIIDVTDNLGYVDVEITADIYNTIWNGDYPGWSYVNGVKMTLIKVTLIQSSAN